MTERDERVEAVQRMQDYIDENLNERITPAGLAQAACYSPFYSMRIFRELTGLTPADYIRRLRLREAALRLRDGEGKVADEAYAAGFGSQDGFQRAFRREFGTNPREYARDPRPLPLFTPYGVKFKELWKEPGRMEKEMNVFIQRVEKPCRKAIIKRGIKASEYWTYCEEVGCDVWGLLVSMRSLCGEPVCMWLPEEYRLPGTSEYVMGVEVAADYAGETPDGFDIISLPASSYLMFQSEPFAEEDYCEAIEEVQAAIGRYDPSVIGLMWEAASPRIQLEQVGSRGYIELCAVRALDKE